MSSTTLPVRLKTHEYARLRELAKANGLKPSTYVKVLLSRAKLPKGYQTEQEKTEDSNVK